jgi:tripartite-type tricarboxylate transporter receptor subunit TctC
MFARIASLVLTVGAFALPASAADYPDHAIKMIVPFAAGGGTDVLARIVAQNLNSKWGQPVVVENQPGASGGIGTRAVMKAPPDGYTLLMASTGALMAVSSGAGGDGPFDVNKLLSPIAVAAAPPYLLVASPTLPVTSTADLIRYAKEKPEGLTFGSSGVGAASHLSGLLFASATGIKLLHIPYKGTGPALTDLLGGHIPMAFAPIPASHPSVTAGLLRALAVTSTTRSGLLPEVPTIAEQALPGFDASLYYGLVAPAGTPRPVIDKLNKTLQAALASDEVKKQLGLDGTEITPGTPEDYSAFIDKDEKKWAQLVKASGVEQE